MLDDDQEYDLRRQIRAQTDEDVATFIAQLDSDVGSGVPPPPRIEVTEVSSQPVELELLPFGGQGSGAEPAPPTPPGCGCGSPTIFLNVADMEICPDCFSTGSISVRFSDVSINGNFTATRFNTDYGPGNCLWEVFGTLPQINAQFFGNPDCSGSIDPVTQNVQYFIGRFFGIWYFEAILGNVNFHDFLLFYATSESHIRFVNRITCSGYLGIHLDDPFQDYVFGDHTPHSGARDITGIASAGAAIITC